MGLTVLIYDAGARADAISHAYEESPRISRIIVAPGNDFIAYNREKEVLIDKSCILKDPYSILETAKKYEPDIIEVAQDDAVACGATDLLRANNFNVFGPTQKAARIEWDKAHSRKFMEKYNIPSPQFRAFGSESAAIAYLEEIYAANPKTEVYIKAGGLCAGKGALDAATLEEGILRVGQMKKFGDAGKIIVIEDWLKGEEFSGYAISDGNTFQMFKTAQDNKRSHNFDEGDQTGGMGAVSPAMVTAPYMKQIEEEQMARAFSGMKAEGAPYEGILYLGGIIADGAPGEPKRPMNIEFNARWGDPEGQEVIPSVENYVELVLTCLEGKLEKVKIKQDKKTRVGVVGASRGYPNDYSKVRGKRIYGLEDAMDVPGVEIFGAGIDVKDGKFYANGGRLFTVVGEGENIIDARQKAYSAMAMINIEGNNLHYRTDIGWRDVERFLSGVL